MNYQEIVIGLVGGLFISQVSYAFNKVYDIIYRSEQRRDAIQKDKICENNKMLEDLVQNINKLFIEKGDELMERYNNVTKVLNKKSVMIDKKLSLIMSKVVSHVSTPSGCYQTNISSDANSLSNVNRINEIIGEGDKTMAKTFNALLSEYENRDNEINTDTPNNSDDDQCN